MMSTASISDDRAEIYNTSCMRLVTLLLERRPKATHAMHSASICSSIGSDC
jgi:hypothetical protein